MSEAEPPFSEEDDPVYKGWKQLKIEAEDDVSRSEEQSPKDVEDMAKSVRKAHPTKQEREEQEAAAMAADLAQRDQNDADVQEIARQVGVFCRGLDEAGVKHGVWPSWEKNNDRTDALQIFVITEVGRLRDKQRAEDE